VQSKELEQIEEMNRNSLLLTVENANIQKLKLKVSFFIRKFLRRNKGMPKILSRIRNRNSLSSLIEFSKKVRSGKIEKGMKEVEFLLRSEFITSKDGKSYFKRSPSIIEPLGLFMIFSGSFVPYVIVDTTLKYGRVKSPEQVIELLDRVLYHELTHQLCPPEWTWDESLAISVEKFLVNKPSEKKIPIIEVE